MSTITRFHSDVRPTWMEAQRRVVLVAWRFAALEDLYGPFTAEQAAQYDRLDETLHDLEVRIAPVRGFFLP